ncbi:DoxX family protein [Poseidonibacter lekithochrous]|uniref:HvfX family Cu-binding RiPP maturation protein n=1 Tax=Poseidonibacter lekithochrous TaxID=1904463 RepID=UPI000B0D9B5A|nr:DoxX family protein [Poseidonibacter lekithochrous]QKJ23935.1 DoxX family protein [Poseidonibacter lekithochrous]
MISKINDLAATVLDNFQSLFLLLARLTIAYGFFEPAINKWKSIEDTAAWFASMGIPFSTLNVYMVATFESLGVVLLALGLFTRLISLPLIGTMVVAIITVHFANGFSSGDNGFEIPLYYLLFLGIFASFGAGKLSLDNFLSKK